MVKTPIAKRKKKKVVKKRSPTKRITIKKVLYVAYLAIMLAFISYHIYYANRVVPRVLFKGHKMTGMNSQSVVDTVRNEIGNGHPTTIHIGDNYTKTVYPEEIGFRYLPVETSKRIFEIGRSGSVFENGYAKLKGLIFAAKVQPQYAYDVSLADEYIERVEMESMKKVKEPQFILEDGVLLIKEGRTGYTMDHEKLIENIIIQMIADEAGQVYVPLQEVDPILSLAQLDALLPDMKEKLSSGYVLFYEKSRWPISQDEMLSLVIPVKEGDSVTMNIHQPTLQDKLHLISSELDRNPGGQVLEIENGKAVHFIPKHDGLKLKVKESADVITNSLLNNETEIELSVQVTEAPTTGNEFNVEDLIGEGNSRFKGSIPGRIHNIGVAALRVHGTLVPAGEVFSFNEAVGPINKSTGYTSAWIISKGRTVLGDGGGVCQVSTTVFRAALDAGFPIVERSAHAYRVSYYEQESTIGFDATIYRPSVDLKFLNDTDGYILVTSEFDKENYSLAFRIYGKDDGRVVEMTEPVVTSRTAPPSPVYIETDALAKGTTKQVEYPIWGATAVFTRTVSRDGEVLFEDTFKSRYRAWGAVYEVGTRE